MMGLSKKWSEVIIKIVIAVVSAIAGALGVSGF